MIYEHKLIIKLGLDPIGLILLALGNEALRLEPHNAVLVDAVRKSVANGVFLKHLLNKSRDV